MVVSFAILKFMVPKPCFRFTVIVFVCFHRLYYKLGTRWFLIVTLMRTRLRSVSTAGDSREQSKPGILILLPFVIYVKLNLGGGGMGVKGRIY